MPKWRANLRCGTTIGSKRKPVAEILHDGLLATVGRIEVATRICEAHNADIDALTAERDELQRRLDAVIPEVYVALFDRCYCEEVDDEDFDEQEQCEYCLRIAKLRAIAEGREG